MAKDEILLGLSLGYCNEDGVLKPGLSNEALGKAADREQEKNLNLESILQWEIGECVKRKAVFTIREHRVKEKYLDTEEVIAQAIDFIRHKRPNVKTIRLVAYAFLHRPKCKKLIKKYGFEVKTVKTGWIPCDRKSAQWWTRNPLFLVIYAVLQILFGRRGH